MDGLTIIRTLRKEHINTPVLILSALGEVDDRVEGLTSGGDDYLVKPYAFSELLARLQVLARRSQPEQQQMHLKMIKRTRFVKELNFGNCNNICQAHYAI